LHGSANKSNLEVELAELQEESFVSRIVRSCEKDASRFLGRPMGAQTSPHMCHTVGGIFEVH
jgi:hypothetical protein